MWTDSARRALLGAVIGLSVLYWLPDGAGATPAEGQAAPDFGLHSTLIGTYCVSCHNEQTLSGGLALEGVHVDHLGDDTQIWEKVVRKLRARAMPPAGAARPDEAGYEEMLTYLEAELDRVAMTNPNPGRTDTFRRLNRTEYQNAVRDLLALDVDVTTLLPRDDAAYGFDNVSSVGLSPMLMERYLSAALKVSRLAVGSPMPAPGSHVAVLPADLTQEGHLDGLPFGTRGGMAVSYNFPLQGEYELRVRLSRNRNENVEGLTEPHVMELSLDGERLELFTITPNRNRFGDYYADEDVDRNLVVQVPVDAGPHVVAATFLQKNSALIETEREPFAAHFNMDRHPRIQPGVRSVGITGPFETGGSGSTPSRERVFVCRPPSAAANDKAACARTIISTLARRAYRRPVTDDDISPLMGFYERAGATAGFEGGIETALRALLSSTEFLFRIERDADHSAAGTAYRLDDLDLATRLSFFLWSSIPDDELLTVAERGELSSPGVLESQVRRMLADPRAESLSTNFAGQWLHLRNLDAARPNLRLFPDFDDNLRQGFRRETELLFDSVVREDRSVVDLLTADYTHLNERLAGHYGIPHVYGDHFRRVQLPEGSPRIGMLGHGSILTVTSYATRTSPVLRGKWVLDNVLGMPPPPPPATVPPLPENEPGQRVLSMRERMVEHRANRVCAACHQLMDPAGLAMENFDAIGRWRDHGAGRTSIDASGSLPGGATFEGIAGLRAALLARPDVFVGTLTEKLVTFALGRGIDYHDAPAVRAVVREAAPDDYRFSSLVLAITKSRPFQMRRSQ